MNKTITGLVSAGIIGSGVFLFNENSGKEIPANETAITKTQKVRDTIVIKEFSNINKNEFIRGIEVAIGRSNFKARGINSNNYVFIGANHNEGRAKDYYIKKDMYQEYLKSNKASTRKANEEIISD